MFENRAYYTFLKYYPGMNKKAVSMQMPTSFGTFRLSVWPGARGRELVALSTTSFDPQKEILMRIHSECLTGDVFHSSLCDCEEQKDLALQEIQASGNGIFIYHRQEGRNAGLYNKARIYNLMERGLDTYSASVALTGHADNREYSDVLEVLRHLASHSKC